MEFLAPSVLVVLPEIITNPHLKMPLPSLMRKRSVIWSAKNTLEGDSPLRLS